MAGTPAAAIAADAKQPYAKPPHCARLRPAFPLAGRRGRTRVAAIVVAPIPARPLKKASAPTVAFYFDPISPYSWLASLQVGRLDAAGIALDFRPVLFAGLLAAHGTKGPAEIPAKRAYTFRDVMRQAQGLGARAEGPPAHPFNPLRALRMCIALDEGAARRRFGLALMDAAWARGLDLAAPEQLVRIADENDLDGAALSQRADDPGVKERLAAQTSAAAAAGIFGVPTFVCADEIFWGADRIDAVLRRAAGHAIDEAELAAKLARPASAVRKA